MPKLSISPPSLLAFLSILLLLNPTFATAQEAGDVDEKKQGQTVESVDINSTMSPGPPPLGPGPARTGPKSIIPGWDDSLAIACIVGGISLIVVIPMFVYIWHRRRRLRRARVPPRSLDKVTLVNRKASLASVDGQESPLPSPRRKLESRGTGVSFASEVTIMDQVPKPQPVFHAI
ncbi:hypothetical protein C7212DRAFT_351642 [Tuber magnatum]|uniref:Mid2 domain-containing protein n=1 Tax=Tuber magnatum TaxID=42249 RepID=A0A317SUF5_9PEZI|nr:hypothetical protein C7212DRAFT_351642 [Tuber magnatum]